jgi:uncharacterized protein with FMN-binding domain
MRKGIVIILAVAIIGALGIYGKSHSSKSSASTSGGSSNSSTLGAKTTPQASSPSTNSSANSASPSSGLKNGTFTGAAEETPYGPVQIAVVVSGGKVADVNFLMMPNDRGHTQEVTAFAEPLLKQETLGKQNANIDFVSGATQTSEGYQQSLQSALDQAA